MKISLLVLGAPYSCQSTQTALRFTEAALDSGHTIYRVFFYHDAVNTANSFIAPPQDEVQIPERWGALAKQYQLDLVVCIASTLKRGVLNQQEATRYDKTGANLHPSFDISGLGQWVDAMLQSDRVITFGP